NHSRSAVLHENEKRHTRRYSRLSRAAFTRLQVALARRNPGDVFLFSPHQRCNFIRNNFGGAGGCAPIGTTASALRTSARSPSRTDHAGDGIFQGCVVGNEAVVLKSEPDCMQETALSDAISQKKNLRR